VSAGIACQAGSVLSTLAIVSDTSSPGNARCPASISNSTTPNAQMSARLSTARPLACSGAMYAAVPRITPTPDITAGDIIVGDRDR
jgi:hypothetical protein